MGGMLLWLLRVTSTTPERPTVVFTGKITLAIVALHDCQGRHQDKELSGVEIP